MGWLDNSTNNIILDAVLTDYGRQALARNDGSFNISKFALGDDEINYTIIRKYGRTVGREKIEKNTPIFEAFTNQAFGLKYKLVSVPRPLLYMPKVELTGNISTITLSTNGFQGAPSSISIAVKQSPTGGETLVDPDLLETNFDVYVPDLFLRLQNLSPIGSPDINKIALYSVSAPNSQASITLATKSIPNSTYVTYGKSVTNGRAISTSIKFVGRSSGATLDIPVVVQASVT
jgi:hypothetical protein